MHHSDQRLEAISSARQNWMEALFNALFISAPMIVLFRVDPMNQWETGILAGMSAAFLNNLLTLSHMNVRWQVGWWSRFWCSPQMHRIHHSLEPEHIDRNFAFVFPMWDVIFGTYYQPKKDEFPATGVAGEEGFHSFRDAQIYTPREILEKPDRLTDAEFAVIKRHADDGAELLSHLGEPEVVAIVRHHHERLDGGGYPAGLSGSEIPLGARIIAVADTYDVLTARDSYRKPVSSAEAIAELRRVAGTQLDPAVVSVFVELLGTKDLRYRHGDDADFETELAMDRRIGIEQWAAREDPRAPFRMLRGETGNKCGGH
jgi:hypothetical protein